MLPDDIVTSGFPSVRDTCKQIRITFDPWQVDVARAVLGKTRDGLYAADTVVLSIPRQVGKTFLVGAVVFADCIINPGTTVVWTAHRFKVARETFIELRGLATRPEMLPHLDPDAIFSAAGNESITFRNGSRIVFAARERGAVRGFTKVRRIVLDEAQILTEAVMADFAPTMNQAQNPQMILMGTPPKPTDPGEVFTSLRAQALAGDSEGLLYVELSAPRDADPDDRDAWREANPSYPRRTSARAIMRLRKLLSPSDFMREALGVWDEDARHAVIPAALWGRRLAVNPPAQDVAPAALAVDMSHDRVLAVAGCWLEADVAHVEVLAIDEAVDSVAAVDWLVDRAGRRIPVLIDSVSPAASLVPALKVRGVQVVATSATDMSRACGGFFDAVDAGSLTHAGQAQLDDALAGARKRPIGNAGGWGWDRRDPSVNIAPLVAVTLAHFGAVSDVGAQALTRVRGRVSAH